MSDVIKQARNAIETRLRELITETERLERALDALDAGSGGKTRLARGATARGRRDSPTPQSRRGRAGRGERQEQFLDAVKRNPGAKVPDIARDIGLRTNQVYGLARRLHDAGKVTKRRGGGYVAKS